MTNGLDHRSRTWADALRRAVHLACALALVFTVLSGPFGNYLHDHLAGHGPAHHHSDDHHDDHDQEKGVPGGLALLDATHESGGPEDHQNTGLHTHDLIDKLLGAPDWRSDEHALRYRWIRPGQLALPRSSGDGTERPPRQV